MNNPLRRRNENTTPTTTRTDLYNWMDRMFTRDFDNFFANFPTMNRQELTFADWTPAVDVEENAEAYVIRAEIPQVKKEDVKITVQDGILTLTGERRQDKEEKGKRYHRVERSYGCFARSFTLPDNADENHVDATYTDGVLTIKLQKTNKPKNNTHEITVK